MELILWRQIDVLQLDLHKDIRLTLPDEFTTRYLQLLLFIFNICVATSKDAIQN